MNKITSVVLAGVVVALVGVLAGCEWQSNGSDGGFNTSQGAGLLINFSGVYAGQNGAPVAGSNITQLVISQSGNTIEVWDNNNSYYVGTCGSPGVVAQPDATTKTYPAGAIMVQSQINFSGKDEVTGQTVVFAGMIHAVAVTDVRGTTSSTQTTQTNSGGTNNTQTTTINAPPININNQNTSQNQTTSTTSAGSSTSYSITAANTHYNLQGNWVEQGNSVPLNALAAAANSTFTP